MEYDWLFLRIRETLLLMGMFQNRTRSDKSKTEERGLKFYRCNHPHFVANILTVIDRPLWAIFFFFSLVSFVLIIAVLIILLSVLFMKLFLVMPDENSPYLSRSLQ